MVLRIHDIVEVLYISKKNQLTKHLQKIIGNNIIEVKIIGINDSLINTTEKSNTVSPIF